MMIVIMDLVSAGWGQPGQPSERGNQDSNPREEEGKSQGEGCSETLWFIVIELSHMSLISIIHKWIDKMYHQERLTSESLQSLYDVENGEKPEADRQIHRWEIRNCTFWCEMKIESDYI